MENYLLYSITFIQQVALVEGYPSQVFSTLVNDRHKSKGKTKDPSSKKKNIASQGYVLRLVTDLDSHPVINSRWRDIKGTIVYRWLGIPIHQVNIK